MKINLGCVAARRRDRDGWLIHLYTWDQRDEGGEPAFSRVGVEILPCPVKIFMGPARLWGLINHFFHETVF